MNLNEALEKHVKENFSSPDNPVFHYTNEAAYQKIISSNYLKLTSHKFLNKRRNDELKIGVLLIKKMLCKFGFQKLIPQLDNYINNGITFFTASFCQEENSSWAIGKYGRCIFGFEDKFLKEFSEKSDSILFGSVKYGKIIQEKIISDLFELHREYKNTSEEPMVDLFIWLSMVITLLKEEKHHKDNECRVAGLEIRNNEIVIRKPCPKILLFNSKNYNLIDH